MAGKISDVLVALQVRQLDQISIALQAFMSEEQRAWFHDEVKRYDDLAEDSTGTVEKWKRE